MGRLTKKVNENRRKYKLITNADLYPGDYAVDDYCVRLDNAIDKLGHYEDIEDNRNINIPVIFKALEEGFWIKETSCYLSEYELDRFKYKNSSYYDEENKLIFCPGVKADTDRVIHAKPSLAVTLLDGKITYYLSSPIACVLLEDYGVSWALTKEELE